MLGTSSHRILVTGSTGQLGGELISALAPLGEVIAPLRDELDLSNAESIRSCVRSVRPTWIVNAGAYTAVDKAESDAEQAFALNALAPEVIGMEARHIRAGVVHFSTDYVFSGKGSAPYVETDPTGPLSVYGASKLAGEQALLASGAAALIFRTSWVYGAIGRNFLKTILKLARERKELRVVADQFGAPTWSRDLARMTAYVVRYHAAEASIAPAIYHAAGAGETTWAGFAAEALRQAQDKNPSISLATVAGIPASEYPTAASRPANSRLNCQKLSETFGWRMMAWEDSLSQVLAELKGPVSSLP